MKQTKIGFTSAQMDRIRAYVEKKNAGHGPEWSIASTVRVAVQVYLDSEESPESKDGAK